MIPSYTEMMLPILKFISGKQKASRKEVIEFTAKYFKLTEDEKLQRTSNGTITYVNRADWALIYMASNKQILALPDSRKVIKKIDRGVYEITKFGNKICSSDNSLEEFRLWYENAYKNKASKQSVINPNEIERKSTPNDIIEESYTELKDLLKSQILDEINAKSPKFFEDLVKNLLVKMGYGEGTLTKDGADGGIDGVINEDELGISKIYIQAKRWQGNISRPELNKFAGAILDKQTKKGVFITTSKFTKDAEQYAKNLQDHSIALIDGERLAELMIKYKVGVQVKQNIEICEIDKDFFDEFV